MSAPAHERLSGRGVVITGASRGLGRAIATALAARGARLVLTARDERSLGLTARSCREAGAELVEVVRADLESIEAPARIAACAASALGRIDGLVNNAALLGDHHDLIDSDRATWDRVLAVDLSAPVFLVRECVDLMAPGSVVINVTSSAAGRPHAGGYGVVKLALDGVTRMLAEELRPREIRCVAVDPGAIRTDMRRQARPEEDPLEVPDVRAKTEPFLEILGGADLGPLVRIGRETPKG